MVTKIKGQIKESKTQDRCQYCGKIGGRTDMIHKKCALEYIKKLGFSVYKFKSPIEILEGNNNGG